MSEKCKYCGEFLTLIDVLGRCSTSETDHTRSIFCVDRELKALRTELATVRRQLAEREAECERLSNRVYSHEAIWTDQCNDDAKKRAQELADSTGRPCEVNVHGSKQFTAYPSRIKELQREVEKLLRGNLEEVRAIVRRDFREAEERVTDKSATEIAELLVDAGVITSNACTWVLGMASKYLRDLTAEVSRLKRYERQHEIDLQVIKGWLPACNSVGDLVTVKAAYEKNLQTEVSRLTRERDEIQAAAIEHAAIFGKQLGDLTRERDTLQAKLERVRKKPKPKLISEQHPPRGKCVVRRNGLYFTASPCYGMHEPWWVVRTMPETWPNEVDPVGMVDSDEWWTLDELAALISDAAEREE